MAKRASFKDSKFLSPELKHDWLRVPVSENALGGWPRVMVRFLLKLGSFSENIKNELN